LAKVSLVPSLSHHGRVVQSTRGVTAATQASPLLLAVAAALSVSDWFSDCAHFKFAWVAASAAMTKF
jgi:hypothetical protein